MSPTNCPRCKDQDYGSCPCCNGTGTRVVDFGRAVVTCGDCEGGGRRCGQCAYPSYPERDAEYQFRRPASKRPTYTIPPKLTKEQEKEQRRSDTRRLRGAVGEVPRDMDPGAWKRLLKALIRESKRTARGAGDPLFEAYKIARELELKWRDVSQYSALPVIKKEEYQRDVDRLLHFADGYVLRVLTAHNVSVRDESGDNTGIAKLYHIVSRAEFLNTLRVRW